MTQVLLDCGVEENHSTVDVSRLSCCPKTTEREPSCASCQGKIACLYPCTKAMNEGQGHTLTLVK